MKESKGQCLHLPWLCRKKGLGAEGLKQPAFTEQLVAPATCVCGKDICAGSFQLHLRLGKLGALLHVQTKAG